VNISAKRKIFSKIFWDIDLGPIDLYEKNQSSKISCYCPFKHMTNLLNKSKNSGTAACTVSV